MIFEVEYPNGERAWAVGNPGEVLRVDPVPRGPESCLGDRVEVDFSRAPCRVLRIVGGPRRPTLHVRVPHDGAAREAWIEAREAEGWATLDDAQVVWFVATQDGLDAAAIARAGGTLVE